MKHVAVPLAIIVAMLPATLRARLPGDYDAATIERKKGNEKRFKEFRRFDLSPEEHLDAIEATGMWAAVERHALGRQDQAADFAPASSGDEWVPLGPTGTPPLHAGQKPLEIPARAAYIASNTSRA